MKAYFIIGMPEDTPETLQETYDMIMDIDVDEPYVTNLLPFPGTRVFDQALRDRLFVDESRSSSLWRATGFHYTDNNRFYLKPYRMSLCQLQDYREKFEPLFRRSASTSTRSVLMNQPDYPCELSVGDLATLFGATDEEVKPFAARPLGSLDLRYRPIIGSARDSLILNILQRIDAAELQVSGEDRRTDWERGWRRICRSLSMPVTMSTN